MFFFLLFVVNVFLLRALYRDVKELNYELKDNFTREGQTCLRNTVKQNVKGI